MKNQVNLGKTTAPYAYVIPADQRKKADIADLVNIIRREGVDVSVASQAFKAGTTDVKAGDYVVRMDQPYRGIVEMYMGLQWYPPNNPRPYDDTGWSIPLLHNIKVARVDDKAILDQPMTTMTANAKFAGSIQGTGSTVIVDHTTDNALMTFRFANAAVKMQAAEQAFDMGGHHFVAGAFVIPNANRAALESQIQAMGLQAWATDAAPSVPMHDLEVPRVGYIHSWQSTQDEGWWRAAFDARLREPQRHEPDSGRLVLEPREPQSPRGPWLHLWGLLAIQLPQGRRALLGAVRGSHGRHGAGAQHHRAGLRRRDH
jgi:hypothetical protein